MEKQAGSTCLRLSISSLVIMMWFEKRNENPYMTCINRLVTVGNAATTKDEPRSGAAKAAAIFKDID